MLLAMYKGGYWNSHVQQPSVPLDSPLYSDTSCRRELYASRELKRGNYNFLKISLFDFMLYCYLLTFYLLYPLTFSMR